MVPLPRWKNNAWLPSNDVSRAQRIQETKRLSPEDVESMRDILTHNMYQVRQRVCIRRVPVSCPGIDPYSVSLEKLCACWCQNQDLNPGLFQYYSMLPPSKHVRILAVARESSLAKKQNKDHCSSQGLDTYFTSLSLGCCICEMGILLVLQRALVGVEKGQ